MLPKKRETLYEKKRKIVFVFLTFDFIFSPCSVYQCFSMGAERRALGYFKKLLCMVLCSGFTFELRLLI